MSGVRGCKCPGVREDDLLEFKLNVYAEYKVLLMRGMVYGTKGHTHQLES